eukprot:12416136-Ditylum_brightwellii.AAC.1
MAGMQQYPLPPAMMQQQQATMIQCQQAVMMQHEQMQQHQQLQQQIQQQVQGNITAPELQAMKMPALCVPN